MVYTRVSPCNCADDDGLQIHCSKTVIALLVALLDTDNKAIWSDLDKEEVKAIKQFGKVLARDIKVSLVKQRHVERNDGTVQEFDSVQVDQVVNAILNDPSLN